MAKNRRSLAKPRRRAYSAQNGRCWYCKQPMWEKAPQILADKYRITLRQAQLLQNTGEHLRAHSEGGGVGTNNIVAACKYCNQHRHRRKYPLTPDKYRSLVQERMKKGKWHGITFKLDDCTLS